MSISNFISNCVMTATIFLFILFRVSLCTHSESAMSALPWSHCYKPRTKCDGSVCLFHLNCCFSICVVSLHIYIYISSILKMQINWFPMKWPLTRFHIFIQYYWLMWHQKILTLNDHIPSLLSTKHHLHLLFILSIQ